MKLAVLSHNGNFSALLRVRAENSPRGFGTSCAHQSGEAQDLALPEFKADILHHSSGIQVFHLQYDRRILRNHTVCLRLLVNDTSYHHVDDIFLGAVLSYQCSHIASVPHDGNTVGDDLDLVHTVRDVDNAEILLAKITDDVEQIRNFLLRQSGGGLIKDDQLCVMGNCLGNLTHLLLADGQLVHLLPWIDINMQFVEQRPGILDHFFVINPDSLFRLASDKNVLGHGQIPDHVQLLMNNNHAGILCLTRILKFYFLAFVGNRSGILFVYSGENLHQR